MLYVEEEARHRARVAGASRGMATPDVLLRTPAVINGRRVRWIECKLFYGAVTLANNGELPVGKLSKQAARYDRAFSEGGAFVFGQGYCADLRRVVARRDSPRHERRERVSRVKLIRRVKE